MTQLENFFATPIGQMLYVAREARYLDDQPFRNMAVGFVDITGLNDVDTAGYEIVDVAELKQTDPALYQQIRLADRPQIQRLAIVRQSNDASSNVPANHSEILMITRELTYLGVKDPNRLFAVGSDRSPCPGCAPRIPKDADVFYLVEDGKGSTEKLKERIWAAKPATENNAEYKKKIALERQRFQERKVANKKRRAEKTQQTKNVFNTGRSCQLGLGVGPAATNAKQASSVSRPGGPMLHQATFTYRSGAVQAECDDSPTSEAAGVPDSGLVRMLSEPVAQAPGGIDFSSLQLRYLSDPGDGSGLQYSFEALTSATGGTLPTDGVNAARLSSDAFFVWLSLNPQNFWVNLNPNEPNRIVDDQLGRTDAGRVLLEADLRMKKTVGELIHPHSAPGRKFWDGVQGDCLSFRNWILPAPASVHQEDGKLYILDAPLDVKMETQYLASQGQSSARSCPRQDKTTEDHNEALFRSQILPKLKHAINNAPEYAALRRVYLARVAAQWYRELSQAKKTTYGKLIDSDDIGAWATKGDWKPKETFDRYVDSYTKGEFKVTDKSTRGNTTYVKTYVYGGVDLTNVPFDRVSDESFAADFADLPRNAERSLKEPSTTDGGDTVWLGSPTPRQAAGPGTGGVPSAKPASVGTWALRLLPVCLLPAAVLLWWRRRRPTASAQAGPLRRAEVGRPGRQRNDSNRTPW
ncbi:hypothetical protein OG778_10185 [Streptomyces sp. NBC_00184]|uniref:hypothetical protein n=1 Tax=Streptomyces sp. NBC_00184 TaxID=2975673 RepID=UPI002E290E06|nr:hypothetical protein [Streptomyces sp. NBC_00184]